MKILTSTVRLSGEEYEALEFIQKRMGEKKKSDAIRNAIMEAADRRRELKPGDAKVKTR